MKKILILGALCMLLLPLVACGGRSEAGEIQADEGSLLFPGGEAGTLQTQPVMSLLFGTLMLEDSELAINSAMAMELLPLWQAARTIYTSGTSAAEEKDAILEQISGVMTAEQLVSIQAMELTTEDMRAAMREVLGGAFPEGMQPGEGSPDGPLGREGMPPGSQPGQGFGGRPGFGEGISPEARSTMLAERGGTQGMGANPRLFEILIELLQQRANE
jgi:hypothetical protein